MSRQIHPIPVEPTGTSTGLGFGCGPMGCNVVEHVVAHYPDSPRGAELRALRGSLTPYVRMGDVARALEISVVEVSGLERGSHTLSDEDWIVAFDEVRKLGRVQV